MVGLPARLKATVDPPPDGPVRTKKLGSTVIESDTWPTPVRYGDGPKGRAAATAGTFIDRERVTERVGHRRQGNAATDQERSSKCQ
jgi:hypothetical protein